MKHTYITFNILMCNYVPQNFKRVCGKDNKYSGITSLTSLTKVSILHSHLYYIFPFHLFACSLHLPCMYKP